jgi:hypothetical protein
MRATRKKVSKVCLLGKGNEEMSSSSELGLLIVSVGRILAGLL